MDKFSSIKKLYGRYSGPEIARKLGISKSTVYRKLRKLNIEVRSNYEAQKSRLKYHKIEGRPRNRIKIPSTRLEKISESYIIGSMFGDGYLDKFMLRLGVTQREFMLTFAKNIKIAYGILPSIKEYRKANLFICTVNSASVSERISKLTKNKSVIPIFVTNDNKEIKGAFLRGFADSEGCVDTTNNRHQIVISQKNIKLMRDVKSLLWSLLIQSKIYKKENDQEHLVISLLRNVRLFNKFVGFSIPYKIRKLRDTVNYLEKIDVSGFYWDSLRKNIDGKSTREIALDKGIKYRTVLSWLNNRRIPRQIKKDIEYCYIPNDYEILRKHFKFLPKISSPKL